MTEGDSPTVARRRLRMALRESRDAQGLTQQQVADEMEWSLSKVIRIENGDVSISPNDLRPLLSYFGIKDRTQISSLLSDARIARTRQRKAWYQDPKFREELTDTYRRLIEYEAEATEIRYYSVYFMPGPIQVPAYSAALMQLWDGEMSQSKIDRLLEARKQRGDALMTRARERSVKLFLLLDESVLTRPIGGPTVFANQLGELLRLAVDRVVDIRMIPFTLNAPVTNNASFDLLMLGPRDEGLILYHENGLTDELVEEKQTTSRHLDRYDKVWHQAQNEDDTIAFIRQRIDALGAIDTD
jgi:transcriptional regulator with XRE-family HTH domain